MSFIINLMSVILMTFARVMSVVIATWIACALATLLFLMLGGKSYTSIPGIDMRYGIYVIGVLAFIGIVLLWFFVIKPLWKLELWDNLEENLKALFGLTTQVVKNIDMSQDVEPGQLKFESVDTIVTNQLTNIESDHYDPKMLLEIYRDL